MRTRPCKLCGLQIIDARAKLSNGEEGNIVLSERDPVYQVLETEPVVRAERHRTAYVSHFSTCEGVRKDRTARARP